VNFVRLQTIAQELGATANSTIKLSIAQRGVQSNPGGAFNIGRRQGASATSNPAATKLLLSPTFTPINANLVLDQTNSRLAIAVPQIDGEYILTVQLVSGNAIASNGTIGSMSAAAPLPTSSAVSVASPPAPAVAASAAPTPASPQASSAPTSAVPVPVFPAPSISISVPAAGTPSGVPVGRFYRRQVAPLAAPAAANAPPASASGLVVSMNWVISQANIQTQGLAVNVGAMMAEYASANMELSSGYPLA
jgi:hypothetical protein